MRRSWVTWGGAILLLLGTPLLSGCKQQEGERCQLDSDCADNLRCCLQSSSPAGRVIGGACASVCVVTKPDVGVTDQKAATDLTLKSDLTPDKQGMPDTAPPDKPTPDRKTADQLATQ